jgi:hypothetical protein
MKAQFDFSQVYGRVLTDEETARYQATLEDVDTSNLSIVQYMDICQQAYGAAMNDPDYSM